MELTICLTKEDIETRDRGFHFEIIAKGVTINFTPEALEELEKDIAELRRIQKLVDEDRAIKD